MSELFLTVLNMSLTASYVILCVAFVRLLLKKAPKSISYALWIVVAFRLIIPFSFESMFSLMPRNTNTAPIPHEIIYQQTPQIDSGIEAVDTLVNNSLPAPAEVASANPLQIYVAIGAYIWGLGIFALLVYSLNSVLKLKRKLKSAKLIEKNVYQAENLQTPFVLGLIRPKIYLPVGLNNTERSYILLHEKTHIQRKDHIIKVLAFIILSIHWFNPLVWIAFRLMSTDMELSCDEKVLRDMKEDIKKPYANLLLNLAAGRHFFSGSPLAFGEGNVKGRIKNVLSYKRPRFWMIALSIVTISVVGIGLVANPTKSEADGIGFTQKKVDFSDYPQDYSVEQGIEDGFFVIIHGAVRGSSQFLLNEFIQSIENKKSAYLKILQYTIEGDPIFISLTYDGDDKPITATFDYTRDKFGNQTTITVTEGKYIKLFEQEGNVQIYLTDKDDLTLDEAINGSLEGTYICGFHISDTISDNDLLPINGQHQHLRLRMVKGKSYEDWNPGAYMGTIWEGDFIIELTDESGTVISTTDLSKIYEEPLIFNSAFQIQFDDYNNDGDIDFTIGQHASSNGRDYKLFTLRKDGRVEEMPIKGYSSLFISNTTGFYSTKLTKIDNVTFKIEYYDNSKGENIEKVFKWNGKEFVHI